MKNHCAIFMHVDTRTRQISTIGFNRFSVIGMPFNIVGDLDSVKAYGSSSSIGLSKNTTYQEFDIMSYIGNDIKNISKNKALGHIG